MRKKQENEIKAILKDLASGDVEVELALEAVKEVVEIVEDDLLGRAVNLMNSTRGNLERLVERSHGGGSSFSFGGCTKRPLAA